MKSNFLAQSFIALLIAIATIGCSDSETTFSTKQTETASVTKQTAQTPRLTLLAFDWSQSTEEIRSKLLGAGYEVATNFDPNRDTFRAFRFASRIEEFYSQLPEDDDAFAIVLANHVRQSDPVGGTDYPAMLEMLAKHAANTKAEEVRIIIVGDGQNDARGIASFEKRYREAAKSLAKNPKVVFVRWWGVDAGTREEIRDICSPLGTRLQIQSLDQNPMAP